MTAKFPWTAADDEISAVEPEPQPAQLGGKAARAATDRYGQRVTAAGRRVRAEQAALARLDPKDWPPRAA